MENYKTEVPLDVILRLALTNTMLTWRKYVLQRPMLGFLPLLSLRRTMARNVHIVWVIPRVGTKIGPTWIFMKFDYLIIFRSIFRANPSYTKSILSPLPKYITRRYIKCIIKSIFVVIDVETLITYSFLPILNNVQT